MRTQSEAFMFRDKAHSELVGEGLSRQLLGYDDSIMMVKVNFEVGAIGARHSHIHSQVTYVVSGEFDVYIDGVESRLGPGDSFYVAPNLEHGAICRKAGVLIDVFSPVREDFLAGETY